MEGTASFAPVIDYLAAACPAIEFRLVDIGCGAGIDSIWRDVGPRLRALAINQNAGDIERLRAAETHPGIEYVAAGVALAADHPFAVGHPARSHWSRNPWQRLSVVKSVELMQSRQQTLPPTLVAAAATDAAVSSAPPTIVVPDYLRDHGIGDVDFLEIDVDGADFDILNSFDEELARLNVLGVGIKVNYFGSGIDDDRAFHNVDRFMKARGFELFDATVRRYSLAALPSRYLWNVPAESEFGRPMFGDALYVRDLGNAEHDGFTARLPHAKLVNLICIFAAFNLPDCAADLVLRFPDRLKTAGNPERILDLLAAQAQGPGAQPLTYSEYLRRFTSSDGMFFDARKSAPASAQGQSLERPADPNPAPAAAESFAERDRAAIGRLRALGWTPGVVFDVGASNGSWSDEIATVCPEAQYHLFEPLARHVPQYRDRLPAVLRDHRTFTLHPVALGDRVGEVLAFEFPNPQASTTLPMDDPEPGVRPIRVPVTTIDALVQDGGLPRPNLLKIDVQGSELAILLGAQQVLPSIDVLLLETWFWRGYEGKTPLLLEIASWLAGRGFYLWDVADAYRDASDVLDSVDCFFINAQSMAPYLTYRSYRAIVGDTDTGERARLLAEVARLRADLQQARDEAARARM